MKYILTAEEMMKIDTYTIEHFHVPSIVLMERAAQKVVAAIQKEKYNLSSILIVCGNGNNGGDGFAVARILHEKGYKVDVFFTGIITHMSPETRENHDSCLAYKIPVRSSIRDLEYTLIIDAMFGIGLNRELENRNIDIINDINAYRENGTKIVAIDIPSGVSADTGKVMGAAIKADLTVTFGYYKKGMMLYPGAKYVGKILLADIGITKESMCCISPNIKCLTLSDLKKSEILQRDDDGNKGTFGKALIIAGNEGMTGCAVLSALSCFKTGVGMVRVFTHVDNKQSIIDKVPEAIVDTFDSDVNLDKLSEALRWADVIGIGPGLGKDKRARKIFEFVFFKSNKPFIIDADAIALLKEYKPTLQKNVDKDIILTPHIGELSRFTDIKKEELLDNIISSAVAVAKTYNLTCVAKDARTIIASKDGDRIINVTGNNGMASAGMGDCLLGIITALRARGFDSFKSSIYGCYIHGMAGDIAARKTGKAGLLATNLINELKTCLEAGNE